MDHLGPALTVQLVLHQPRVVTFIARNWFSYLRKALRARGTTASLHGGDNSVYQTAVMVYDKQPIADHFRWTGEDEVAGMMVVEGDRRRYFFRLKR